MKRVERREFLAKAAATGIGLGLLGAAQPATAQSRGPVLSTNPFTLGVASGSPTPDGFVLWTRLAADPLNGGAMGPDHYPVNWWVGDDPTMTNIVASGTFNAVEQHAHSVHVEVAGLDPDRWYWYVFTIDGHSSPFAKTRTLPAPGSMPSQFRIGQASCQRYTEGEFLAYEDMAGYNLDLVVHLGDYIYETHFSGQPRSFATPWPEPVDLVGYRNTYALYKSDLHLQAAHRRCPWVFTWDDHEVENNYQNLTPVPIGADVTGPAFAARRAAAYQAWWEHMPVRGGPPSGGSITVHDRLGVGDLATIYLLDTRQHRTANPCNLPDHYGPRCAPSYDPATTFLGTAQESWLSAELASSSAVWEVLGSPNVMHEWKLGQTSCGWVANNPEVAALFGIDASNCATFDETLYLHDSWDGYPQARSRLLGQLATSNGDVVVLSGDVHSGWAAHVLADFDDPASPVIGTEFVGPALTSNPQLDQFAAPIMAMNQHLKWAAGRNVGWVFHLLSPNWWGTVFRGTTYPCTASSTLSNQSVWLNVPGLGGAVQWA